MKLYIFIALFLQSLLSHAESLNRLLLSTCWHNNVSVSIPADSVFDKSYKKYPHISGNDATEWTFLENGKGYKHTTIFSWSIHNDTLRIENGNTELFILRIEKEDNKYTLYLKGIGNIMSELLEGSILSSSQIEKLNGHAEVCNEMSDLINQFVKDNDINEGNYDIVYGYIRNDTIFYSPNDCDSTFLTRNFCSAHGQKWGFLVSQEGVQSKLSIIRYYYGFLLPRNTEVWLEKSVCIRKEY